MTNQEGKVRRALNATKQKLLTFDRFPEPIKLNFNKKDSMPSICGSLMTILCYIIVTIYAVQRF